MYNHRSYFNFEAGRGSIYKSPPKTKPKTNPGKQFADSMKAAGIGSIGGKPTTSAAKKIQDRFRKQAQKDNNKGSTYDEIALPSEATIDKKIKGLGARPEVTVTELDYTVQQGDTVSEIAQQFGTTVEEILKLNKDIEDKDVIKTGQEIKLPVDAITAATKEIEEKTNQFINDIGTYAEDDHGDTPVVTADAKEANLTDDKKSLDIGYGHKIRRGSAEDTSGLIYGIKYKNADGSYIPLTEAQKRFILKKDYEKNAELALKKGWNRKLKERGTSWDNLDYKYRNALSSLAFNVGGAKAGEDWTQVLQAAKDKDPVEFARELRRKDAGENTAGMDNRVMKELYYAGIIKNRSEVASVLPEADARSGVPR